jgi:hypothetical protein
MKIKSVEMRNLKGRTTAISLAPVTVLTGPSFSGKTAVLDAVKVGLVGYHPRLGKRPSDTFKLATGTNMEIGLTLNVPDSEGQERHLNLHQTWTLKGGSVIVGNPLKEPLVPTLLLDIQEYLGMTGPARTRYVFDRVNLERHGFTTDGIMAELRGLKFKENGPQIEAALRETLGIVGELAADREREGATLQQWCEATVEKLKETRKAAETTVKRMEGTVKGQAQLQGGIGTAPARNRSADIERSQAVERGLADKLSALATMQDEASRHAQGVRQLEAKLTGVVDYRPQIEAAAASLAQARVILANLTKIDTADLVKAEQSASTAKYLSDGHQADIKRIKASLAAAKGEHDGRMALKACPFCKSSRKGWQEHLTEDFMARAGALGRELTAAIAAHDEAEDAANKARLAAVEARARYNEFTGAEAVVTATERSLTSLRQSQEHRAHLESQLAALKGTAPATVDASEVARLQSERQTAADTTRTLRAEQTRFIEESQAAITQAKANELFHVEQSRVTVFKSAEKLVLEQQWAAVERAVDDLMAPARKFTDGILRGKLEFRDGEIGYQADGQWITHDTFSGTEEAIAYAGLAVALAQESKLKLVLIDELGIIDPVTRYSILDRMLALVADGTIDQFIGADAAPIKMPEGVTEIQVK